MERKTKLIAGLLIALLAAGALLVAPSVMAQNDEDIPNGQRPSKRLMLRRSPKLALLRYILRNGEHHQLTGEAMGLEGYIMVLETDEDTAVSVIAPKLWIVTGEVMSTEDLFDGDPLSLEESTLTVDTIKAEYSRETYVVTAYLTFKITSGDVSAEALLPFNIEVIPH